MKKVNCKILTCFLLISSLCLAEDKVKDSKQMPFYDRITGIINSLEYSGLQDIVRPEVSLSLDFNKRTWHLQNIHKYDEQGGIILEEGRYGLCAELSTYLYQKIKEFLPRGRFELEFAQTTEPGFFPNYESNHIVLLMIDRQDKTSYLLDPSFHKYGPIGEFSQYQIGGIRDALDFVRDKATDVTFEVDQAMPLFIKDDRLISFSVTSLDGKFDKDNFFLVVAAHRKNEISAINIIVVGKYKGKFDSFESDDLVGKFLSRKDVVILHKTLSAWLVRIQQS